jgi:hypothetical protein
MDFGAVHFAVSGTTDPKNTGATVAPAEKTIQIEPQIVSGK